MECAPRPGFRLAEGIDSLFEHSPHLYGPKVEEKYFVADIDGREARL